jgi:hypothetical protein
MNKILNRFVCSGYLASLYLSSYMGCLRLVKIALTGEVNLRYYASQYAVCKKLAYITSLIS